MGHEVPKMVASFTLTAIVISLWISCAAGKKNYSIRPDVVLPASYVKEIPPPSPPGQAVIIYFDIYVVDINSINVEDMDFRVDMFARQQWTEPRLQMPEDIFEEGEDSVTLPPEFFDNLWQPDPYIINSKVSGGQARIVGSAEEIATLNQKFSSVTLYRNKTVRYSARMHAIVACQMEFQLYPMDIQLCPVYIESFSYNERKLRLKWGEDAVSVNPALKLLQYRVGPPELREAVYKRPEKDGNFSRLTALFRFERQIGHHLIQTFAPSTLVVMLSWCGFWLGLDAIPGRVTLLVTCMLTLVTMFTGLKQDIPPVAYVKALDVWMAGCMLNVFGALGEFVVVKVLNVRQRSQNATFLPLRVAAMEEGTMHCSAWQHVRYNRSGCRTPNFNFNGARFGNGSGNSKSKCPKGPSAFLLSRVPRPCISRERVLWRHIDHLSRIIFPVVFVIFLGLYWPILLYKSSRQTL